MEKMDAKFYTDFIDAYNVATESSEVVTDDIIRLVDAMDRIGGDYLAYVSNHPYVLADAAKDYIITKAADSIDMIKKDLGGIIDTQKKAIETLKKDSKKKDGDGATSITVTIDGHALKTKTDEILHKEFKNILAYVAINEPIYLVGPAGTGKSHIVGQVAKALDLSLYYQNCIYHKSDIEGYCDAYGIYHPTQFYEAFKKGGVYMLDEMDASIPEALNCLNTAIANRIFTFPAGKDADGNPCGGLVKAHDNFRVVAAGNTLGLGADAVYTGRNQLDGASLNRFGVVRVDYDPRIEAALCPDKDLLDLCRLVRKSAEVTGLPVLVSYREISRVYRLTASGMGLDIALKTGLFKNLPDDDLKTIICGIPLGAITDKIKDALK